MARTLGKMYLELGLGKTAANSPDPLPKSVLQAEEQGAILFRQHRKRLKISGDQKSSL